MEFYSTFKLVVTTPLKGYLYDWVTDYVFFFSLSGGMSLPTSSRNSRVRTKECYAAVTDKSDMISMGMATTGGVFIMTHTQIGY